MTKPSKSQETKSVDADRKEEAEQPADARACAASGGNGDGLRDGPVGVSGGVLQQAPDRADEGRASVPVAPIAYVRKAHVLAEFVCVICGGTCLRMTTTRVLSDGTLDMHADPFPAKHSPTCNECEAKRREKEAEEVRVARQQKYWANRKMPPGTTIGRPA